MKRFWDWLRHKIGLVIVKHERVVERVSIFDDTLRFHLIYRTNSGAEARDAYTTLTPRTGELELYDGSACRGRKVGGSDGK